MYIAVITITNLLSLRYSHMTSEYAWVPTYDKIYSPIYATIKEIKWNKLANQICYYV